MARSFRGMVRSRSRSRQHPLRRSTFRNGALVLRLNTDDPQWIAIFGPQIWKRWLIAFFGAIILEYGAGIAGGCTSGLAISGGMLLAPAAFLFIAAMFASGIITAMLVYRRRY